MWSVGLYAVALLIIALTHWVYKWRNPKCNGKLPPGSMGLPLVGETLQFFIRGKSLDTQPFFKKRLQRYGQIFKTSLVGRQIIVTADPEFNHYVFSQEGRLVQLWYLDSFGKLFNQETSIASTGGIHKYLRSSILRNFGSEMLQEKLLSEIEAKSRECLQFSSTQESVDVRKTIATMVFGLTSIQLFSYDITQSSENMCEMFLGFIQSLMSFPVNIPGTTFHKCIKKQQEAVKIIKGIIDERRNSAARDSRDFLDQLMDDMETEAFVSEEFVVNVMFGLLVATFDSIATTITLAIILLTDNPAAVQELKKEHEAILRNRENKDSPITWKEYKSMTFTSQVLNETLRLTNFAPAILRKVIKDIEVHGYTIPKGWTIMAVPSAIHMNPKTFEDPLTFNPWRWKDIGRDVTAKNFKPFGGGMRECAGAEFSKAMTAMFLHVLVTNYTWTKVKGCEITRTPALSFGDGFHIKVSKAEQ